ncbi:hypothetical protein EJ03DRAFT_34710 [Teratosphaeria nubilosa]|uniref:Uncharacterized protein n=1 Tax=Teratosphaeria nubilosa TaxID=161662 RepID=A0A6G1KUF3_9PEZI|nr:hypothetical protein EJ03DRAFT_34710 [Teratosphaeria nubilosa]
MGAQYVYLVTQRDFEHYSDYDGRLQILDQYAKADEANDAAQLCMREQIYGDAAAEYDDEDLDHEPELDISYNDGCGWFGSWRCSEDERDRVDISILQLKVKGGKAPPPPMPQVTPSTLKDVKVMIMGSFHSGRAQCALERGPLCFQPLKAPS